MLKKFTGLFLGLSLISVLGISLKSEASTPEILCSGTAASVSDTVSEFGNLKTGNFIGSSTSNSEIVEYCNGNIRFSEYNNSGQLVSRTTGFTTFPNSSYDVLVATGDLNNDGNTDLLYGPHPYEISVSGLTSVAPKISLMNGTTISSNVSLSQSYNPNLWRPFGMCDMNGDNKTDIVWQGVPGSSAAGQMAYWLMNGTTFVSGGVLSQTAPTGWNAVDCKDYNNDGKNDFLWVTDFNYVNGSQGNKVVGYWLMNGLTYIGANVITTVNYNRATTEYVFLGFAKYNGSAGFSSVYVGKPQPSPSQNGYWQTNGSGTITSSAWFTNPNNL